MNNLSTANIGLQITVPKNNIYFGGLNPLLYLLHANQY